MQSQQLRGRPHQGPFSEGRVAGLSACSPQPSRPYLLPRSARFAGPRHLVPRKPRYRPGPITRPSAPAERWRHYTALHMSLANTAIQMEPPTLRGLTCVVHVHFRFWRRHMRQPRAAVEVVPQVVLHGCHLPAPWYEGCVAHGCHCELAREGQDPPAECRHIRVTQATAYGPRNRPSPLPLPRHQCDFLGTGLGCSLHGFASEGAAANDDNLLPHSHIVMASGVTECNQTM